MLRWPLSEALIAYEARLRERAMSGYRHQQLLYVFGGLKKAPKVPPILEESQEA